MGKGFGKNEKTTWMVFSFFSSLYGLGFAQLGGLKFEHSYQPNCKTEIHGKNGTCDHFFSLKLCCAIWFAEVLKFGRHDFHMVFFKLCFAIRLRNDQCFVSFFLHKFCSAILACKRLRVLGLVFAVLLRWLNGGGVRQ